MQDEKEPTSLPIDLVEPFLKNAKINLLNLHEYDVVTVVMGNETCDLDSVCSSIAYGIYFYDHYIRNSMDCVSIALLDITAEEIQCKTEVIFWMKKLKVEVTNFVFRDQINLAELKASGKLRLILVDHHVLAPRYKYLQPAVIEIIDHRPLQPGVTWPEEVKVYLEPAGSCATLVAKKLLKLRKQVFTLQFVLLLYGPIVLDTAGLSPTSGRTTDFDAKMVDILETMYEELNRERVLRELVEARADVSELPTRFLLMKDMKFAGAVPILAIPISIKKLLERDDLDMVIKALLRHVRARLAVIMGQEIESGKFMRTLAVFATEPVVAASVKLVDFLQAADDPNLQLVLMEEESNQIPHLTVFTQGNDLASRKQVLPLVLTAISKVPELNKMRYTCPC